MNCVTELLAQCHKALICFICCSDVRECIVINNGKFAVWDFDNCLKVDACLRGGLVNCGYFALDLFMG